MTKIAKNSSKQAFTIIELIVASSLAAMLMVVVLGVLGSLAAQRKAIRLQPPARTWRIQLVEQLRWDLSHARRIQWSQEQLRLLGFGSQHTDSEREPDTHRAVEIIYAVYQVERQSWLTRREVAMDGNSNANDVTELVCLGVTGFDVLAIDDEQRLPQHETSIPAALRVILRSEDEEQPICDQSFLLR